MKVTEQEIINELSAAIGSIFDDDHIKRIKRFAKRIQQYGIKNMDWQPIETAPIGVTALFLIKWGKSPAIGEWDGKFLSVNTEHISVSCGTYCYGGSVCTDTEVQPTHWMPLPDNPSD